MKNGKEGKEGMAIKITDIVIESEKFHLEIKSSSLVSLSVDYLEANHLHLYNEWTLRLENALRDTNLAPGTHLKKIQSAILQKIMQHPARSQICR